MELANLIILPDESDPAVCDKNFLGARFICSNQICFNVCALKLVDVFKLQKTKIQMNMQHIN